MNYGGENKGLPEGWREYRLRDITLRHTTCNPRKERIGYFKYIDIDAVNNNAQRIESPKNIPATEAPSRARVHVREGDILFSLVRPYLKNIAIVPKSLNDEIASTAFIAIRPDNMVESRFLFYQLSQHSFINKVETYGNTPPSARDEEFLDLDVVLPPYDIQVLIADKIEKLFSNLEAGLTALERVQANLQRYRASVLKAAVEGRLTQQWRAENPDVEPAEQLLERILAERRKKWEQDQLAKYEAKGKKPPKNWQSKYKEPSAPDTTNLPELPSGWCWASVEQLGEPITGVTPPKNDNSLFGGSIPFFKPTDLDAGYKVKESHDSLTEKGAEHVRLLPANTVMVTCIGATIGKTGLTLVPGATNQQINSVITPGQFSLSIWLYWVFSGPWGQKQIKKEASATTLPILNKTKFAALPIPLPPKAEIEMIIGELEHRFSLIERVESHQADDLKRASHLRQSILKHAFEGRLFENESHFPHCSDSASDSATDSFELAHKQALLQGN
jgi:type I restriction enzyme S subunit